MTQSGLHEPNPGTNETAPGRSGKFRGPLLTAGIGVVLAAIIFTAFWSVVHSDFIKLDDRQYVVENPHLAGGLTWQNVKWALGADYASNWHPITWLSHMLDVQLFGLAPGGHHFVSLLLHTANALLLFGLLLRITGTVWRSAMVAALFALHPLHVESVAWVAERKDVLSTFFLMLTLLTYTRYAETARSPGWKSRVWFAVALIFFSLGLMSKPMLVTVPALLLLLDFWPLQRLRYSTPLRVVLEKIPFTVLALVSCAATFLAQSKGHNVSMGLPLLPRLVNAIVSYVKYLGLTFWPANLAVFYPHPDQHYPVSHQWAYWKIAAALLLLAGISAAAVWRRKSEPWLAVGWFWYLITLVPVIGFVQVGQQAMADRYTYIPLIGIFICLVWSANQLLASRRAGKLVLSVVAVLLVTACAAATHRQVKFWQNNFTLFQHALNVTSDNAVAYFSTGMDFLEDHQFDEAVARFQAALDCDPSYADAHASLGFCFFTLGRLDEAMEQYQTVIQLRPWDAKAHASLGSVLWRRGQTDAALKEYGEALRLRPDLAPVQFSMGCSLAALGRDAEAADYLSAALRLKPDYTEASTLLEQIQARQRARQ